MEAPWRSIAGILLTAQREISWPSAGTFLAAYREDDMAAVTWWSRRSERTPHPGTTAPFSSRSSGCSATPATPPGPRAGRPRGAREPGRRDLVHRSDRARGGRRARPVGSALFAVRDGRDGPRATTEARRGASRGACLPSEDVMTAASPKCSSIVISLTSSRCSAVGVRGLHEHDPIQGTRRPLSCRLTDSLSGILWAATCSEPVGRYNVGMEGQPSLVVASPHA